MSVLTGTPRRATVYAETDVHALGIHRDDLEPILRARPEIAIELGNVMASRVSDIQKSAKDRRDNQPEEDNSSLARQLGQMITQFFGIGQSH